MGQNLTFITRGETCPPVAFNSLGISQAEDAKYLRLHLDRRLNWRKYIFTEREQLEIQSGKMAARQQIASVDRKEVAVVQGDP